MSKLFYNMLNNIKFNNATSPSGSTGSRGSINRDPKAVKARRVGYQISNGSGGGGGRDNFEEHDVDLSAIASAIRGDGYLTQGVMKYEELIFKSGWSLQSKNDQALDYLKFRLDMMEVATGTSMEKLFLGIARDIVWSSNCFIAKARAKNGAGLPPGVSLTAVPPSKDPVVGYFILPPQTISIARDQNGEVTKYQQEVDGGGDAIEFKPEDIIHIATNVRSGSAYGDPWLAPVIEDVRLLRKIEENSSLLLYKHIFPILKYIVGKDKDGFEATDDELQEVQAMVDGMSEDSIFVMPERHDVEAVNVNAIDGNPYLQYFENRVFSGMGLSQVDFGRGDTANRNTADAMTGQKADRVKGWQKVLQTSIDKFMINELLIEGGFDPLINPDFDVDFVFNEIEQERVIAKENHEIQKFNNNIQTWEETRLNMGMDPVAEESRLHYQMIASNAASESGKALTDNKNQPENQNGKRNGPKRTTEFQGESLNGISLEESNPSNKGRQTAFQKAVSKHIIAVNDPLNAVYSRMKMSVIEQIETRENRKEFPLKNPSEMFSFNQLESDKLASMIEKHAKEMFQTGVEKANGTLQTNAKVSTSLPFQTITSEIEDQNKKLEEKLLDLIDSRLGEAETEESVITGIASVFEAMRFKVKANAKSIFARSYNYGYALTLMKNEDKYASVHYEGDCESCKSKNKETIDLKKLSSLDEVAIFYRIPPWHPNCECEVVQFKGGEK